MTTPINGFQTATPVEPPAYSNLEITGDDNDAAPVDNAIRSAVDAGLITFGSREWRAQGLRVTLSTGDGNDRCGTVGDYLVVGTTSGGALVSIDMFNGPDGTYNNRLFSDAFNSGDTQ